MSVPDVGGQRAEAMLYGIIVFDPFGFSWSSFGGMKLADATRLFHSWDRSRGDHRVYAVGVTLHSIDGVEIPISEAIVKAFHNTELDRQQMHAQVTILQTDQTAQLKAARIAAWEMAAQTAEKLQTAQPNQWDGALEAAVAIREMAKHASVGALPMILHCPKCGTQHIDEDEWATTRLHKTHQCQKCMTEWRPARIHTVGVKAL